MYMSEDSFYAITGIVILIILYTLANRRRKKYCSTRCPKCGQDTYPKTGAMYRMNGGLIHHYHCSKCGHSFDH